MIISVPDFTDIYIGFCSSKHFCESEFLFSLYRDIHSTNILLSIYYVPGIDPKAEKKTVGLNQDLYPGYIHLPTPPHCTPGPPL